MTHDSRGPRLRWSLERLTPRQRDIVRRVCWRALAAVDREGPWGHRDAPKAVREAWAVLDVFYPGWRRCAR